ncbi:DoxX-like family protein [Curvibacter sp. PAE-UM]|uniref:DoxX-like family protein n=1 Tax=Curvibacter sp. PAE-UM TaxID=1714344 RepID=UPI00071046F4|nr:DoxX-like family protein [Curvibacter sp. PAE-UM]KRI00066.1 hypothetical protein AO057_15465 [Curvibacter sp. PAE-UM]
MAGKHQEHDLLRLSLVFVWLYTALASFLEMEGRSAELFIGTVMEGSRLIPVLIWGGIAVDVALGVAMYLRPARLIYLLALMFMLLMTLVATILSPALWLEPLGPLTKNVPIAAILLVLARRKP